MLRVISDIISVYIPWTTNLSHLDNVVFFPVPYVIQITRGLHLSITVQHPPRHWSHARFRLGIESGTGPEPEKKRGICLTSMGSSDGCTCFTTKIFFFRRRWAHSATRRAPRKRSATRSVASTVRSPDPSATGSPKSPLQRVLGGVPGCGILFLYTGLTWFNNQTLGCRKVLQPESACWFVFRGISSSFFSTKTWSQFWQSRVSRPVG